MYKNDWYQTIYELLQQFNQQSKQIQSLETRIQTLEDTIQNEAMKGIDTVEYHFDQLKIENLNGTLHIGLSPNDLNNLEDFSVSPNNEKAADYPPSLKQKLVSDLGKFIYEQGPQMIRSLVQEYHIPIDQGYQNLILKDIQQQLPNRIDYYERKAMDNETFDNDQQLQEHIADQVKKEIYHSLENYIRNTYEQEWNNDENGNS